MPENWLANAAITDKMRQRDVAALDAIREELADAKAENDALRDDVAAGRRRLHIQSGDLSECCVKPPPPPAWIISLPPTGRHRWNSYFTLRERG